jgi:Protein of unknown function (DUF2950)
MTIANQKQKHGNPAASLLLIAGLALVVAAGIATASPADIEVKQLTFNAPEEARQALVDAVKSRDTNQLTLIFGTHYEKLLSGDPVQDKQELELFVAALDRSSGLLQKDASKVVLTIGEDNWPFPIPIVRRNDRWSFDTAAGMEEILNRRIGGNELSAIATCRAYVLAQWEYFTEGDHDNDGVAEYAQHFYSSPGQKDGLYWDTVEGEPPSPMGALVAAARAEGYAMAKHNKAAATATNVTVSSPRTPYHGYFFRIIKRQGPHAPGGKYDYIINGNMIAGYALIAYPDKYGSSGVMTFMVNQQGRVYQKNLGPETAKIAAQITEYDPDSSWKLVTD